MSGVKDRAVLATGKSALGTINTAMGMYYAENDTYPLTASITSEDDFIDALNEYVDNLDELLGDWTVDADNYAGTASTFTIVLTNGDKTLTMDQSGSFTES